MLLLTSDCSHSQLPLGKYLGSINGLRALPICTQIAYGSATYAFGLLQTLLHTALMCSAGGQQSWIWS